MFMESGVSASGMIESGFCQFYNNLIPLLTLYNCIRFAGDLYDIIIIIVATLSYAIRTCFARSSYMLNQFRVGNSPLLFFLNIHKSSVPFDTPLYPLFDSVQEKCINFLLLLRCYVHKFKQ